MTTSSFVGDHNQLLKTQTKDGPGSTEPQAATSKELVQLPEPAAFAVQGFKLYAILVGVCFGAFMMSLDVFILSTVSDKSLLPQARSDTFQPGNPVNHFRISRHVSVVLVSSRLYLDDMRPNAVDWQTDCRIPSALGLHMFLFHIPRWKRCMRLGPKQRFVYCRPCYRWRRRLWRRDWRHDRCPRCCFRQDETLVYGHLQQLLCVGCDPCTHFVWLVLGKGNMAMVLLGQPTSGCYYAGHYALLLQAPSV